ncbi:MAG: hypothetical protein WAM82_02735 [Thermoanaerobaculia bacterium]
MKTSAVHSGVGRGELWIVAAAVLVFGLIAVSLAMPAEEDAFIYYRYAWNWAHGHGLVFNTGDPVEGFSGPIWMMVLALVARAGLDLPRTAPVLGILCGAATLVATWLLGCAAGLSRFGRLAPVAVLALSIPFIVWSRSGLETPFYSLAIVVACGAYLAAEYPLRPGPHPALRWLAMLAPVAVTLGRPEGMLLVLILIADRLTDGRNYRGALRYALPTALGYGGYLVWRFLTFHRLVPNTSVKLYPLLIDRSGSQFLGYVLYLGALPLLLPLLALVRSGDRRTERRRLILLLAVPGLLSVAFNFLSGGDYRPGFRYFIPTLPVLLVAIWYGYELLTAGKAKAARAVLLGLLLVGPLLALRENPPRIRGWRQEVYEPWLDPYSDASHWGIQIALWMDAHVPRNSVVAFGQMGRIPYYLASRGHEVTFVDTLGLVDRQVAEVYRFDRKLKDLFRDLRAGSSLPEALEKGRRERANRLAETVLARHPGFILIETALDEYGMMKALVASPGFKAKYRQTGQLPPTEAPYVRIYTRLN